MEYSVPHKVTIRLHKAIQHLKVRYRYPIINLEDHDHKYLHKIRENPYMHSV